MNAPIQHGSFLRTLLVLGRVSNLPTVWSNCLAGWLLTGEPLRLSFALVLGGATCLYTGGMFLNDVCDAEFDRKHRKERPIPSGLIPARMVWTLALVLGAVGVGLLAMLGGAAAVCTFGLAVFIVAYNWLHKKWVPALGLMALSRSMLYLIAAAAAVGNPRDALIPCVGLGLYVLGISLTARMESRRSLAPRWPIALLLLPMPLALRQSAEPALTIVSLACVLFLSWILWTAVASRRGPHAVVMTVGRLIGGMVFVDLLFVASASGPYWSFPVLGVLLALALLLQRRVPAT